MSPVSRIYFTDRKRIISQGYIKPKKPGVIIGVGEKNLSNIVKRMRNWAPYPTMVHNRHNVF